MTTAYTSLLGLALPVTGELSGTWGDTVNNSITSLLDSAVAGTTNVSTDADVTLTTTTGAANTAREAILLFSGARTALRTITAPAQSKIYTVINATTGGYSVKLVGAGPTTGLTIPNGASAVVAWNGSDFVEVGSGSIGNLTVNGTLTVTGATTLQSTLAVTGNITNTAGTANGVTYLNGSKVLTSGSALTFDGTTLTATQSSAAQISLNNASGNYLFLTAAGGAAYIDNRASSDLNFRGGGNFIWGVYGGSEQMRLNSTGLGIGTSSPAAKLESFITSTSTPALRLRYNSSSYYADHLMDGNGNYVIKSPTANGVTSGNVLLQAAGTLYLYTNNAESARIDSSGNLGLGVTPSASSSLIKAFDFNTTGGIGSYSNSTSTQFTYVSSNAYLNSSVNWTYKFSGYAASAYLQNNGTGQHQWLTSSASGTAGNAITFTQAMTLNASGYLGIGATSPNSQLDVRFPALTSGSQLNHVLLQSLSNGVNSGLGARTGFTFNNRTVDYSSSGGTSTSGVYGIDLDSSLYGRSMGLVFYTSSNDAVATEKMRIDENGNVGIGNAAPTNPLTVAGTGNASYTSAKGIVVDYTGSSTSVVIPMGFSWSSSISTQNPYWGMGMIPTSFGGGTAALGFYVGGSEVSRFSGGNLGVGTTSPVSLFETYGSSTGKVGITVTNSNGSAGPAYIAFKGYDWVRSAIWHDRANNAPLQFAINPNTTDLTVNGCIVAASFDSNGNLGIGTTSPVQKLEVSSGDSNTRIAITNTANAANGSGLQFLVKNGGTTVANATIRSDNSDNLQFFNIGGERARITSGGDFLVGTTSVNGVGISLNAGAYLYIATTNATSAYFDRRTSTGDLVEFRYSGSKVGSISTNGTITAYNVSSDKRLKENIVDAPEFGSVIDSLQVRSFDWKSDQSHQRAGFIAQELLTVAPEAVTQPSDVEEMMGVDYSKLVPMLVKEIQSLRKRLADAGI